MAQQDATMLLDADHNEVIRMFEQYKAAHDARRQQALASEIRQNLLVHMQIEEEIFYPALRGAIKDTDMLDEAAVEHQSAKDLIAQIEQAGEADEMFDAKVKVLGEYIKHHVKEEEQAGGIFAQAKKGDEDLDAMGERLKARKEELMAQMKPAKAN
jgi:hemerythrin superfamily protein